MRKALCLAAMAGTLASPAFAQDKAAPEHMDEIVVTSTPLAETKETLSQGVSVLAGDDLSQHMEGTIGETIASLPGVSSTFFGPGASRPIIRGLGGDRVEMLIDGLGAIDASTVSPDHAVAGQSLSTESVEVIRGPNTLLYGPSAIGGVVNIIDGRIPFHMPEDGIQGAVQSYYGTDANTLGASGTVTVGLSDHIAGHVEGSQLKADDYAAPSGTIPHSAQNNRTGSAGLSYIGSNGYLGVALNGTDSFYGVPGEAALVQIAMKQTRVDVTGELNTDFALFNRARLRFAWADYKHRELEGGVTGTTFTNRGFQGRLELVQQAMGDLSGAMGLSVKERDFDSVGEEAVAPRSRTWQAGAFLLEEYAMGAVTVQGGVRLDYADISARALDMGRSSAGVSASLGVIWQANDWLTLTLQGSHTKRNPTAEELYSNGPHVATGAFELGDSSLASETADGLEAGVRIHADRWAWHTQAYATDYKNFIYLADTGLTQDGLALRQYAQADATFYGFESEADIVAIDTDDGDVHLHLQADSVTAILNAGDRRLPRIPPFSASAGLDFTSMLFDAGAEVAVAAAQHRVAAFETPTPGYTMVNAHINLRPIADMPDLTFGLRLRNLFNATGHNHASFLKDASPLPGRDVRFSVDLDF